MNESQKTLSFVGVAALALVVAWEPWVREAQVTQEAEVGKKLFPDFTNALTASSMEVVEYDEKTSAFRPFRVAKVSGLWSIPSHQDYPADAREHLAQAATSLSGVEILGLVTNNSGEHAVYGVVDPDLKTLKAGAVGVGTRVTLKDGKDKVLADLILGKAVKDQPGLRYVRKAGKDAVYRVSIKTDSLSTKFEDWIEKDLLKLNTLDIKQVQLNDYSSETGFTREEQLAVAQLQRSKSVLAYDDSKSAWNVVALEVSKDKENKLEPAPLAEDEELNSEKLNNLKTALDDLKIVDVERKPKGLSDDLKVTEEFVKDVTAQESLLSRGFVPASNREGKLEIISSEGEAICSLKDGVEYILRFGRSTVGAGEKAADEEEEKGKEADKSSRLNRYLFVTAQFNEALLPKPELEALPDAEPVKTDAKPPADAKPQAEGKPPADEEDEEADEPEKKDAEPAADKKDESKPDDKDKEKKAAEEKRAAVEKENKRKQDEYNDKVKKGQDHVKELNERFADWYYVISDDVYHKVHLSRADIVKKKEKKEDEKKDGETKDGEKKDEPGKGNTLGDFNELEKGLKK